MAISKTVGIDIDGVLADFVAKFKEVLASINFQLPSNYLPSDWNWSDSGIDEHIMSNAWDVIKSTPDFWTTLSPTKDIVSMSRFFKSNYKDLDIVFITARVETEGATATTQSSYWLASHLNVDPDYINVIVTPDSKAKIPILRNCKVNYFIDDHLGTILLADKEVKSTKSYLLNRSWNTSPDRKKINTVNQLEEFFNIVENNTQ